MLNSFIFSDNGSLTDITKLVTRYPEATGEAVIASVTASQDYLYLGARAPFNHYFFHITDPSAVNSNVITAQYWDGREWVNCYRTIDDTDGFKESGFVTFIPNKDKSWNEESTNDGSESITGLTTINVYDLYWLRLKFSLDIPLGFSINFIGQKFSDDYDLSSEFPDLVRTSMLQSFGATKTNWDEQHAKAAEVIALDLIKAEVIDTRQQILVREEFLLASVQKVAQLIYTALGDDYIDQASKSEQEYKNRLSKSIYSVDKNNNALLEPKEAIQRTGFMSR